MYFSYLVRWFILVSSYVTVATSHSLRSYQNIPQRPISFSPPSRHPIPAFSSTDDETSTSQGTIDVPFRGVAKLIPVNFTLSSQVCTRLKPALPHLIEELSRLLLVQHFDGITFPSSEDSKFSPLPVYLGANLTYKFYSAKFMLAFSLKISPLESNLEETGAPMWRSIISSLEVSARSLDREKREGESGGLGSVLVIEVEMEQVRVIAEWRLWSIVDDTPTICVN